MPPKANGGGAGSSIAAGKRGPNQPGSGGSILKKVNAVAASNTNVNSGQSDSRNKVIVRRCPPELPEAVFWQSVEPWIKDEAADWKMYKQGRARRHGSNKESVNSVAYIHFKKQEQVTTFAAAYQGHTFRDSKGNRFTVVVQFAPFQKTPPKKIKPDPLSGTIDDGGSALWMKHEPAFQSEVNLIIDVEYQAFVKSLTEPEEPKVVDATEVATGTKGIKKTTPLLEELRRKKQENARKKAEDVKQSRSAKRAATRAGAAASASSGTTGPAIAPTVGATGKVTAAEAKANKKAERREKRKGKKQEDKVAGSAAHLSVAQAGIAKPAQKGSKAPGGKQKAAVVPKQPEAPPKMTILAPPKPLVEKRDEQPKSLAPISSPAPPPAAVTPSVHAKPAASQTSKPKTLSSFDDIVGQFAKQMQSAPVKKAALKPAADKNKNALSDEKPDGKRTPSSSKASKVTSPSTAASGSLPGATASPAQSQSQMSANAEAGRGRGRGRGGSNARGSRKPSTAGRGGPLSPTPSQTAPAPS